MICVLPMVYMISTSLRPNGALYEYPPRFFPRWEALTLENYEYILSQSKFYLNFLNSVFVSLFSVALAAAVSSAMAFVMGKFHFRGKKLLFGFIILTMIIPGTTMIVPQFELATHLGLVNRLWGLIPFYVAWVIPFSTFMIKGFMEGIPDEITEATYIDGASVWTVYTRISLPLAAPAIASVSIFNFLTAWEEYPWVQYRHQRQRSSHLAHRHRRLFRTAPVHPVGLRIRHVGNDAGSRGDCLYHLPALLCAGIDGRRREGIGTDNRKRTHHAGRLASCLQS